MTTTQQKRCAYCSQPMQTYRICPAREIHGPCVPKLTAPPPGAGGDVGARSDDVMRHDFPALQQFHTKHAMGSLAAPSCLCCGRSTQGVEIGVQHMELPGIVICKPCKDATAPGDAGGSAEVRPTDRQLLATLAKALRISDKQAHEWLYTFDFDSVSDRLIDEERIAK